MKAALAERGIRYEERVVPRDGQIQLFLKDPNGVSVELNYPDSEARAEAVRREVGHGTSALFVVSIGPVPDEALDAFIDAEVVSG